MPRRSRCTAIALEQVPVLRALAAPPRRCAATESLAAAIGAVDGIAVVVEPCRSGGGGAMPTAQLASWALVFGPSANALDRGLRTASVPVIGRIEEVGCGSTCACSPPTPASWPR